MTTINEASAPEGRVRPAPRRRGSGKRWTFDRISFFVVFLGLPLAIFLIFVIYPFIQAVIVSLTDWNGFARTKNFVGLKNFVALLQDSTFLLAVRNVALLGFIVPFITIAIALAIASLVTVAGPSQGRIRGIRAGGLYRTVSFFPYCIPAIVIGLIWAQVYQPNGGLLNGFLQAIGLGGLAQDWLGSASTAMGASMFVIIWGFIGFYTVLFVASIKSVPAEVYEAVRIDGAGRFRTAFSITIPLIIDSVQTAYIYLGIAALDSFVYMSALNPNGGPEFSTLTITQRLFTTAFNKGQFGYATAMGVVLAIVTLLFAAVVFIVVRLIKGRDEGKKS